MRFLTRCLLVAFLLAGLYKNMYAQANLPGIYGKVTNEKRIAAEASTVMLLAAADSSIINKTACDKNGIFQFYAKPGKYLLLVSRIGYEQSITGPYTLVNGKDITIPEISLILHLPQLKEVSIIAEREYIDVRPDKVVLNVQSSIISDGNSVIDILRQAAPGTHVDNRGNISIIGHQNALITIDGKPVHLTGQDLVDYLQSLPSNSVQQIELITNPTAKYDAAGAGIINIISRKGSNAGTNFTLTGGVGYGKFYKANAGLSFNNRMGKINIFGNYNFVDNKTDHTFITDRMINYKGVFSEYDVNYYATQQNYSHAFRLGTDYALSANHTIGVLISGTVNNYNITKNNILDIHNQGVLDSTISTKAQASRGLTNISYDVNYTGKLNNAGQTLSADVVYNNIDRHSSEYIDNYFFNSSGNTYRPALKLQNLSPSNINIWAAKVDYVNQFSKSAQLEAGVKASWVKSDNNLVFGPMVNGVYQSSPNFSSTFKFNENINSAYINYIDKIGSLNIIAGLRAEQTNTNGTGNSAIMNSKVKKSYLDLFPQLQLNYRADEKNEINFSFNRGITRAPYEAVNPFLYYTDLYDYHAGNPNLLPEYSNKIQISYIYNKALTTTLYGSVATNFYELADYVQNDSSKVSINTTKNFGTYSVVGLKFAAPVVFTRWWSGNFLFDLAYQRWKAYAANGDLNKGTPDFNFSGSNDFRVTNGLIIQISGKYESPNFYGIGQFKANYNVDAGISKQLFHRNGTLRLGVSDIFNTHRDRSTINYQNLNMTIYDKVETRIVRLGFTYRFGNISLNGIMKHNTVNEDEQKRAGGVAGNTPVQ